jgi:hypothetical protein
MAASICHGGDKVISPNILEFIVALLSLVHSVADISLYAQGRKPTWRPKQRCMCFGTFADQVAVSWQFRALGLASIILRV